MKANGSEAGIGEDVWLRVTVMNFEEWIIFLSRGMNNNTGSDIRFFGCENCMGNRCSVIGDGIHLKIKNIYSNQSCCERTKIVTNEDNSESVVLANSVGSKGSEDGFSLMIMVAPSSIFGDDRNFFGLTTPLA